jgi:hypothetical protein
MNASNWMAIGLLNVQVLVYILVADFSPFGAVQRWLRIPGAALVEHNQVMILSELVKA